jgi:hypothetical protein
MRRVSWTVLSSRPVLAIGGFCALAGSVPAVAQRASVEIPRLPAAVIDGKLSPGEWDGSYATTLPNGIRLFMRHDGDHLYLGLRLTSSGFPSLCITSGDTLRVLHSSAALASATYARSGSSWQMRKPFVFAMRSGDVGETGKAAQRAYLATERWVASNQAMSGTEREMQVSLSLVDRNDLRLALGIYTSSNDGAVAWPAAVSDGCTSLKTVQGFLPDQLVIDRTNWARLVLTR